MASHIGKTLQNDFLYRAWPASETPALFRGDRLVQVTTWIDWEAADEAFLAFTRWLISFRKAHPILRQKRFLHSIPRKVDGVTDLFWWRPDGAEIAFEVDAFRKNCLLNGLDDIGLTLQKQDKIAAFEESRSVTYPWLDGAGYEERKAVAA